MSFACVPFPTPGAPNKIIIIAISLNFSCCFETQLIKGIYGINVISLIKKLKG
jgi:hypothetical protein